MSPQRLLLDSAANPKKMDFNQIVELLKTVPSSFMRDFALTSVTRNYLFNTKIKGVHCAMVEEQEEAELDTDGGGP